MTERKEKLISRTSLEEPGFASGLDGVGNAGPVEVNALEGVGGESLRVVVDEGVGEGILCAGRRRLRRGLCSAMYSGSDSTKETVMPQGKPLFSGSMDW